MKNYFVIDGGTTNTRIYLVSENKVLDCAKMLLGARSCIDDKDSYVSMLKATVFNVLKFNNLCEGDVEAIIASGMITSEFGLCNLPHILAPAGIEKLHNGMVKKMIPQICDIPFYFIPGVKQVSKNVSDSDMMRGEETELMGLIDEIKPGGACILPGSHSKLVFLDNEKNITRIVTTLTGEMIYSLSQHTILKDAVDLSVDKIDVEYLKKGYLCSMHEGINAALFKVRVFKNIYGATKEEVYSFFMGTVLHADVENIIINNIKYVFIGGKAQIRDALKILLEEVGVSEVVTASDKTVNSSVALGAVKIYEYKK